MSIQRRVALIGTGTGPWISTKGLREPVAKVTGLRPGGTIVVTMCNAQNPANETSAFKTISEDGRHELHEAQWMQVICVEGGRKVICDILSKKVA